MTFWIYNVGMGVPISDKRILAEQKALPLEALSKIARIPGSDEERSDEEAREKNTGRLPNSTFRQFSQPDSAYKQSEAESRQRVFYADQIMSSPVRTIPIGLSFNEGWQLFQQHGFRHFPVTSEKGLVGFISERDMLNEAASEELTGTPHKKRKAIAQLMQSHVLTASLKTSIHEICRVMFRQHIGALPIVDDKGSLSGIITRSDILRVMIEQGPFELWV